MPSIVSVRRARRLRMSRPGAATDTLPQFENTARWSSKPVVATVSTLSEPVTPYLLTSTPSLPAATTITAPLP